ncbi:MAG: tRNA preQ1(34) S-adenosylmethionine ribosyltransferase-isomerase QueA, partial [Burkholderiales bacterium]
LSVDDFDYALPPELIAQHPARGRASSRLLHLAPDGRISDHGFTELPQFLAAGDVLVVNDTRVIKARLAGAKDSGGRVEVLVERVVGPHEAVAQIGASHTPRPGARLRLAGAVDAVVLAREDDLFRLRFAGEAPVLEVLQRHGSVPLPPYITHPPEAEDELRYQTVYARTPGAVAAPTAGLHFDEPLLDALRDRGIEIAFLTLHVGAGTFQPVRARSIADHRMHGEWYEIPAATVAAVRRARELGGSVIAVGTTSLRALEASARGGEVAAGAGETDLFITPGFRFRVVDRLVTNFHLPKSTLLMLVSAFAGIAPIRAAYRHAIAQRYRFFSYGDAMLIDRA